MYLQAIKSDKPLPQNPFTGKIVWMTTFCYGVYSPCIFTTVTECMTGGVHCILSPNEKKVYAKVTRRFCSALLEEEKN
jgi:hypothetical protein